MPGSCCINSTICFNHQKCSLWETFQGSNSKSLLYVRAFLRKTNVTITQPPPPPIARVALLCGGGCGVNWWSGLMCVMKPTEAEHTEDWQLCCDSGCEFTVGVLLQPQCSHHALCGNQGPLPPRPSPLYSPVSGVHGRPSPPSLGEKTTLPGSSIKGKGANHSQR